MAAIVFAHRQNTPALQGRHNNNYNNYCYNDILANNKNDFTYILTSVDIKSESPDCYSNHALRMVEELDGFSVQRKVILVLNGKRKSTLCM